MAENVSESLGKGSRVVVTGRLEQRSWETENGEKRSVVEIVADEVGPSLRWATAQVTRNEGVAEAATSARWWRRWRQQRRRQLPAAAEPEVARRRRKPRPENNYADYGEEPF